MMRLITTTSPATRTGVAAAVTPNCSETFELARDHPEREPSLRHDVNRGTITGTVRLDGVVVANVTFQDGCALVDCVNPALQDVTVCPTD